MGKRKARKKTKAKAARPAPLVKVSRRDRAVWSAAEREAWKLPDILSVSEWADRNRILSAKTSAEPGQWHTSRTPYLRGPMDAFCDPFVDEITLMFSTQVGKTETMLNCLGYAIDQNPGPALFVLPRKEDAREFSRERVRPMLDDTPVLAKHKPRIEDEVTILAYHLDHMIASFAWSESPASLSRRAIRYLFFDETDKFPPFSGREADPIELATERTRTFYDRRIIKCSTPTTDRGYIYREYEASSKERYRVPCPRCGEYQVLVWPQVRWPEAERDPERIRGEALAWYECAACGATIRDRDKPKMLERGAWAPDGAEITPEGEVENGGHKYRHRGFHLSALYSPWLRFGDVAAKFLESKDDRALFMNFVNSWWAEIWVEKTEEVKPEEIEVLAQDYPKGSVPEGVLLLTAAVDVQKYGFYALVRGWGYHGESWLIRAFQCERWEDVIVELWKTEYPRQDGKETLSVVLTCIDSASTEERTPETYEMCRQWRDVARPIKGQRTIPGLPYKASRIDRHPRTGQVIPGGLILWHINTSWYKDRLARLIHVAPGEPGKWHLHAGVSRDYAQQMTSEHKVSVRKGKTGAWVEVWQPKKQGIANHYWDCEVYAMAAADMLRALNMRRDEERLVYSPRPRAAREEDRPGRRRERGGWLGETKGWLDR